MLSKYFGFCLVAGLLFSKAVEADNKVTPENSFKALMECMKNVPVDVSKFKEVGSSQVVLLSVLKEITQSKASIKGLAVDYKEIYELVEANCPKELQIIKEFSAQKTG